MFNLFRSLAAFAFILFAPAAFAQGFTLPNGSVALDHLIAAPAPGKAAPVGTGCTIAAGSTDDAGSCTASAASGSITFATAYASAPFCTVVDASATSTVSMPVYTVAASAITLSTIISTHVLYWTCRAKTGG